MAFSLRRSCPPRYKYVVDLLHGNGHTPIQIILTITSSSSSITITPKPNPPSFFSRMFTQSIFAAVFAAAAVVAAPAPAVERRAVGDHFSILALHSTSAVHLREIDANTGAFYVGRDTKTFCPDNANCPPASPSGRAVTALTAGQDGRLGMDVIVPGGQTAYIDRFGVLRFTVAHSGATPEGAVLDGWTYTPSTEGGVGSLTHGSDAILACPANDDGYLIFVQIGPISIPENCIDISIGTYPFEGDAVWQYE